MIRINLLPSELSHKREKIRRHLYVFIFMILFMVVSMISYTWFLKKQTALIQGQSKQIAHQIKTYKNKINRIAGLQTNIKMLEDKLSFISSLQNHKKDIFVLFNSMSELIVPEKMWLESLKAEEQSLTIRGTAFDNPCIAEFMKNLENSTLFTEINLKSARIKTIKTLSGDMKLRSFELHCMLKTGKQESEDR